ncbi:hypothetical protein ASZ90_018581 [hydrocarbon metagenome]|uniref:Uncharacterized protein n=1 Tax=hydrocarbon metagenome TaxID=938273 RepID=A0A0W8E5V6_9ZZZZ
MSNISRIGILYTERDRLESAGCTRPEGLGKMMRHSAVIPVVSSLLLVPGELHVGLEGEIIYNSGPNVVGRIYPVRPRPFPGLTTRIVRSIWMIRGSVAVPPKALSRSGRS